MTRYIDPVVDRVIESYKDRSQHGMDKYGTPMTRKDIDVAGWLQHLQEELMDATLYIERLKIEIDERSEKLSEYAKRVI